MQVEPLRLGMPRLRLPWANQIEAASAGLIGLPCLVPEGGDWQQPSPAASIRLERPCWVLLAVHEVAPWPTPDGWQDLPHGLVWCFEGSSRLRADRIVARRCPAGELLLPANTLRHARGFHARPHLVILADDLPAAPAPGEDRAGLLAELTRVECVELRAGPLAATVQIRPYLRLTAFAIDGGPSLLAPSGQDPCGLRTWFMAPAQDRYSPRIATRPARVVEQAGGRGSFAADVEPATGLELLWELRLDPAQRSLHLRQGLRSHRREPLRLAVWSLIVGRAPGAMRAMLVRDPGDRRPAQRLNPPDQLAGTSLSIAPGPWTGSGVDDLPEAVLVGAETPAETPTIKAGLRARSGLTALLHDGTALLSRVAADDPGPYPEGDLNLTSYRDADCIEIEHVGPLVELAPGATVWLEQELRQIALPAGDAAAMAAAVRRAWS